jgi:hypothetical protein
MQVPYVSEEAVKQARVFEARLQALPSQAGVLFVSVKAVPVVGGKATSFHVELGLSKTVGEGVGIPLVKKVFEEEIEAGMQFTAYCREGVLGSCRDEDHPRSGPLAS